MDKMIDWIKARFAERTSWDGVTIIVVSLLVLCATPIVKFVAWPALVYGVYTLYKAE